MKYKLREYQQSYVDFLFSQPPNLLGAIAWHGMGLGKTLSALHCFWIIISKLKDQGVASPKALVVCPKSAVATWQTECRKFTPYLSRNLIIVPYSQLHKIAKFGSFHDVRAIGLDEAHKVKNPTTQTAENLAEVFKGIHESRGGFKDGKLLPLTGTPMPNGAMEFYTQWAMCSSHDLLTASERMLDKKRYDKWKRTFAVRKEVTWERWDGSKDSGSDYKGVANSDQLGQLLGPVCHFRRVEDCLDLPEKQEVPIDLNLPDDKLLENANIEEPEHYMALVERLARAKTPYMIDWIRDFINNTSEQLVVFTQYKFPLEEIKSKFKNKVVIISGAESGHDRRKNVELFQQNKARIIALTYRAGSEALNLQNASTTLYHGYPWTDGMLKQAMARTYRQGQLNYTKHYFLTSGQNDMRILRLVREKEEATTEVEDQLLGQSGEKRIITLDSFI